MAVGDFNRAAAPDDGGVDWDPRWDEEDDVDKAAAQIADDEVKLSTDVRRSIHVYRSVLKKTRYRSLLRAHAIIEAGRVFNSDVHRKIVIFCTFGT
jgi:hypothetical protein